jgi:hypothetical protein
MVKQWCVNFQVSIYESITEIALKMFFFYVLKLEQTNCLFSNNKLRHLKFWAFKINF